MGTSFPEIQQRLFGIFYIYLVFFLGIGVKLLNTMVDREITADVRQKL